MKQKQPRIRLSSDAAQFANVRRVGLYMGPFDDVYHWLMRQAWWRVFALLFAAYMSVNAVFAMVYLALPGAIANVRPGSFQDAFFFSVQTIATIGYGVMAPQSLLGHVVVAIESLVGIVSVALLTGLTFAKFSLPSARVLFAEKMVVSRRDGEPHLMVRMANARATQIVEASATLTMLKTHTTREGESMRIQVDLPLVRGKSALFALSWTALHKIDAASPLGGDGVLEAYLKSGTEFFVSISGVDEITSQSVHARKRYSAEHVALGHRYADIIRVGPDGVREVNYLNFHTTEPETSSS